MSKGQNVPMSMRVTLTHFALTRAALALSALALALGCDGGEGPGDPTEVVLGETTFVVVVNPVVNDANDSSVPTPGSSRADVDVRDVDTGRGGRSGASGVVVVAGLGPGSDRTLSLAGAGIDGSIGQRIAEGDLVELALAADGGEVRQMRRLVYPFGGTVIELTPDMGVDAINDALSGSDRIVLLGGGVYEGDLEFSGSNVYLFGATDAGGRVEIIGDVTISGSGNRIRGARIEGALEISGSDVGVSFSRLQGPVQISGSDVTLLENDLCRVPDISGSGSVVLGNRGIAPFDPLDC